jgi:hypothetical protein
VSEVLTLGVPDADGAVVLPRPDKRCRREDGCSSGPT